MTGPSETILVLNAGSSSLKFALYEKSNGLPLVLKGSVSSLDANPRLKLAGPDGKATQERNLGREPMETAAAVEVAAAEIGALNLARSVAMVGHRIVHGGQDFTSAVMLEDTVIERLHDLIPLAPLHQPQNLEIVGLAKNLFPDAVQIGCFDTAFHAVRPSRARSYGLPRELTASGIQSYGFHGLSYAYISAMLRERCGPESGGRVIVAHLGSGASLCAMRDGKSIATTMGFSPLDGLVMSTRCGALDPGVVLYLLQDRRMGPADVMSLLYQRSGLLGVSGLTGDMQRLLETDLPHAKEAVDLFVYRAGREIGSLAAAIGGLDTLVFTAGIGENSPVIRERIGASAGWLGVEINPDLNAEGGPVINAPASLVDVMVIPTDEERAVVEEAFRSG